jgi:hypothetical protein
MRSEALATTDRSDFETASVTSEQSEQQTERSERSAHFRKNQAKNRGGSSMAAALQGKPRTLNILLWYNTAKRISEMTDRRQRCVPLFEGIPEAEEVRSPTPRTDRRPSDMALALG